ncbi:MAG: hypothetical protein ACK4I0_03245 [Brevundimonas sp.]|uniref:hypothetical protein n=1 Tax=Brevundimonas sp. TaxID=1871086 RepID=UPI00391B9C27
MSDQDAFAAWTTSTFEYSLVILLAMAAAAFVLAISALQPLVFGLLSGLCALVAAYAATGLVRPRRVSLYADKLEIRPVVGRTRHHLRHEIVDVREVITAPHVALLVKLKTAEGRTERITVDHRLALVDISIRQDGRTVGMLASTRGRLLTDWAGLPPVL